MPLSVVAATPSMLRALPLCTTTGALVYFSVRHSGASKSHESYCGLAQGAHVTLWPASSAWLMLSTLALAAGKDRRVPGKQEGVSCTEILLESELLTVPTREMSRKELEAAAFHPDANTKKGGRVAFAVPLDTTSKSREGCTKKLAFAGRSVILALPLTTFMPLSRNTSAASLIRLYDWARKSKESLSLNDAKGPGMTVTAVANSKLNVGKKEPPTISPTE